MKESRMSYTCARCGETFEKEWTDDIVKELYGLFGDKLFELVVCDDCPESPCPDDTM